MTVILKASNLSKQYAGLIAVDDFSITLKKGQIHALIGPNGAGKSTAIGLLTGEIKTDTGTIHYLDSDISKLETVKRACAGIAHGYQITAIIKELRVLDNMLIALMAGPHKHAIGLHNPAQNKPLRDHADELLMQFGLSKAANRLAGELAHGEQGRLEIAMCVATEPKVLLLDEPMSGMSLLDAEKMISLLNSIKDSVAILLVEHDMEAVFKLADKISVMASGKIIASAAPHSIRQNPVVIEAYLGQPNA